MRSVELALKLLLYPLAFLVGACVVHSAHAQVEFDQSVNDGARAIAAVSGTSGVIDLDEQLCLEPTRGGCDLEAEASAIFGNGLASAEFTVVQTAPLVWQIDCSTSAIVVVSNAQQVLAEALGECAGSFFFNVTAPSVLDVDLFTTWSVDGQTIDPPVALAEFWAYSPDPERIGVAQGAAGVDQFRYFAGAGELLEFYVDGESSVQAGTASPGLVTANVRAILTYVPEPTAGTASLAVLFGLAGVARWGI